MTITREPIYIKSNQTPKELVVGKDERVNFVLTNDEGVPEPIDTEAITISARSLRDSDSGISEMAYVVIPAPDQTAEPGIVQVFMPAAEHTSSKVGTVSIDVYVNNVLKIAWTARLESSEAQQAAS